MLDQIVRDIGDVGYSFIPELIDQALLEKISIFFKDHKKAFQPAQIGSQGQKQRIDSVRGDFTYWIDAHSPPEIFSSIFELINELKNKLNLTHYLGLRDYETHLAYYPEGSFYRKHLDCFENNSTRKISFIFYLNQFWSKDDGGELILYDRSGIEIKKYLPLPGSFVCFLSDQFPHEVRPAKNERRSLTGWVHNKTIY